MVFGKWRNQITCVIIDILKLFESTVKTLFGSNVQNIQILPEKICPLIQV